MKKGMTVLAAAALSGCGALGGDGIYGDYGVPKLTYGGNTAYEQLITTIKTTTPATAACLQTSAPPPPAPPAGAGGGAAVPAVAAAPPAMPAYCLPLRHQVVGDLIGISESLCEQHKKTIWGNEAAFNIITGSFTNIFSGAAVVVGGQQAKSVLAGLAGLSNAERSLVNETVYKSILVPAVVKKIDDIRPLKKKAILDADTKPIDDYPMNRAVLDIVDYHYACSFMYGLEKALSEGTQPTRETQIGKLDQRRAFLQGAMAAENAKATPDTAVLTVLQAEFASVSDDLKTLLKPQ